VPEVRRSAAQPHAAQPEKVSSGAGKAILAIVGALFLMFLLIGFSLGSTPEAKQRAKERTAIDYCWKEQRRASLTPAEARFIAGACEKMEDDFRAKHHRNP
jgi:hypothetical protein